MIKIKDVWQKALITGAYTGEIEIPGFIITVTNGLITEVTADVPPEG